VTWKVDKPFGVEVVGRGPATPALIGLGRICAQEALHDIQLMGGKGIKKRRKALDANNWVEAIVIQNGPIPYIKVKVFSQGGAEEKKLIIAIPFEVYVAGSASQVGYFAVTGTTHVYVAEFDEKGGLVRQLDLGALTGDDPLYEKKYPVCGPYYVIGSPKENPITAGTFSFAGYASSRVYGARNRYHGEIVGKLYQGGKVLASIPGAAGGIVLVAGKLIVIKSPANGVLTWTKKTDGEWKTFTANHGITAALVWTQALQFTLNEDGTATGIGYVGSSVLDIKTTGEIVVKVDVEGELTVESATAYDAGWLRTPSNYKSHAANYEVDYSPVQYQGIDYVIPPLDWAQVVLTVTAGKDVYDWQIFTIESSIANDEYSVLSYDGMVNNVANFSYKRTKANIRFGGTFPYPYFYAVNGVVIEGTVAIGPFEQSFDADPKTGLISGVLNPPIVCTGGVTATIRQAVFRTYASGGRSGGSAFVARTGRGPYTTQVQAYKSSDLNTPYRAAFDDTGIIAKASTSAIKTPQNIFISGNLNENLRVETNGGSSIPPDGSDITAAYNFSELGGKQWFKALPGLVTGSESYEHILSVQQISESQTEYYYDYGKINTVEMPLLNHVTQSANITSLGYSGLKLGVTARVDGTYETETTATKDWSTLYLFDVEPEYELGITYDYSHSENNDSITCTGNVAIIAAEPSVLAECAYNADELEQLSIPFALPYASMDDDSIYGTSVLLQSLSLDYYSKYGMADGRIYSLPASICNLALVSGGWWMGDAGGQVPAGFVSKVLIKPSEDEEQNTINQTRANSIQSYFDTNFAGKDLRFLGLSMFQQTFEVN